MALGRQLKERFGKILETVQDKSGEQVAAYARTQRDQLIQDKRASPLYTKFTDGVLDAPEEGVKLDNGFISYLFSNLNEAIVFALAYARERSPVKSGDYRDAWFLSIDGTPYTGNIADIPKGAVVTLTNRQRYHRKIDTGGQITSVAPLITEDVRQQVMKRYPTLQVDRTFVTIPGDEPLKGRGVDSGLSYVKTKGKGKWLQKKPPRPTRAKDRRAGQALTYPAVVISERVR